jgi:hypothetical protein
MRSRAPFVAPIPGRVNQYERIEAGLRDGVITRSEAERLLGWLLLGRPTVPARTLSRRNTMLRLVDAHELARLRRAARER